MQYSIIPLVLIAMTMPSSAASDPQITFNKHIAPIVYRHCTECHRPGEAAPFSLLSYEDVSKRGRLVAEVSESRFMPPWKPLPASYPYAGDRRLTDEEIALVQSWVKQGRVEGDPADRVDPPVFSSGWRLGEPDVVVEMPAVFHVPADGPDIYRNIPVALGFDEDKWVRAIDMKPSARTVVHHVLYFADPTGQAHKRPQQGSEPGFKGMRAGRSILPLGGWAVGGQPHFLPEGFALSVPKGSDLVIQYHFHPTGKPEEEKSRIGFYFASKAPERSLTRIQLPPHYSLFSGLDIPAGEKDFVIRDSYTLPVAVDAVSVGAHAHVLARHLKMTATLPDGDVKTLLEIGDWDFAWQDRYFFRDLVPLPKGTKLDAEIHWDNSADNPRNPSHPPVRVKWGEETKDEMGSISLVVVPHEESRLEALRADLARHQGQIVRKGLMKDPALAERVATLLSE